MRFGFRTVIAGWTVALVLAALAAALGVAAVQTVRLAREEAMARAARGVERALEALALGLAPETFETPDGVSIVLRDRAAIDAEFSDPRVALWRRALDAGEASEFYSGELGAVVVRRVRDEPSTGVVEARIPGSVVREQVLGFARRALALTLTVVALALVVALAVARALARPVVDLTAAAAELGRGDLETPMPAQGVGEVGELAATLEAMRRRLVETTGELERRGAQLEAVLSGVSEGVFAVDRDRRVRYLSPRAAALLGTDAGSAIGQFCGDLLRPAAVDGELPCERRCPILQARFRGPVRAVETLRGDAGPRAIRLSSSPPAGGLQVQIVREETADEAARRARDAVVADLAHELKTPLAAQRASLELLRERLDERDDATRELAAGIEAGALRLQRLIDNLLESVRIESGELSIRRLPVELDEVVEEATSTTSPLAAKRGQRIEVDLPYPLPALTGDPARLTQVLVNLLANASKFAPGGSEIRLGAEIRESEILVWVEDEGPGFDPAAVDRGATRFRRGGAGESEPEQEGSGLGLWIARSIVERHGGRLEVERVDARTRVTVALPVSRMPAGVPGSAA